MDTIYDLIILGTGPAGLQAAIHASRAKASVLVMGRSQKSSLFRAHVENYCCTLGVTGQDLLESGREQAQTSGAVFLDEDIIGIEAGEGWVAVRSESGQEIKSRTLVLAMGISRNKLNVPGEKELLGKGVSYCVDCDANFFRNAPVAVIGSESAAVSGAMTLLFYSSQVHLICDDLNVTNSLAGQVKASGVVVHKGNPVKSINGQNQVESLTLYDDSELAVEGVFIELGAKGAIELAAGLGVNLDPESFRYIVTDKKQQTNIPGIYAAGDICGPPWQMAKAVGEGCVAGLEAAAYAKKLR